MGGTQARPHAGTGSANLSMGQLSRNSTDSITIADGSPMNGNSYTCVRYLNKGAFGKTYLATRQQDPPQCVIKIVDKDLLKEEYKASAFREVEVFKGLFHPNIVQYFDHYIEGQVIGIVMEYCELGNLYDRVTEGEELAEVEIWEWFVQVCKGLEYMHSSGVLHRDLTTKNIFISKDDTLRIGDFGLAKKYAMEMSQQLSLQSVGCSSSNAPEMILEQKATDKSDVWAAGCILYFMATRRLAFAGISDVAIGLKIGQGQYPPIPQEKSKQLRDTVAWLLTVKEEDRPSIGEVLANPVVSVYTNPTDRLWKVYKLKWTSTSLLDGKNRRVLEKVHDKRRDDQMRYEGIAELMTEILFEKMHDCGLVKLPVPKRDPSDPCGKDALPDFNHPGTVIFASKDYKTAAKLLVLVHGGGERMGTKAGQWARRTMIYSECIESGTQLPYIRTALQQGYGLIILNGNDKRPDIEGCRSFEEHASYVWKNYVMSSEAAYVAIKSHSYGGSIVNGLCRKYKDDFRQRVFANAYTGDVALDMPDDHSQEISKSWIVSGLPRGSIVRKNGKEVGYSAGTTEHSLTPNNVVEGVFTFIEERYRMVAPTRERPFPSSRRRINTESQIV
ncbi:uncharacterized protein [Watersipora subatra]|uniref:uncharacterized protein n=1 Tax=Watersipora subatra TaxID=2589382 RepID=UPI00355B8F85